MMNFVSITRNFVSKTRDCVSKARNFAFKMMNFAGEGCVIGDRAIIKSCVVLMPGTVVPPDAIVLPFSVL